MLCNVMLIKYPVYLKITIVKSIFSVQKDKRGNPFKMVVRKKWLLLQRYPSFPLLRHQLIYLILRFVLQTLKNLVKNIMFFCGFGFVFPMKLFPNPLLAYPFLSSMFSTIFKNCVQSSVDSPLCHLLSSSQLSKT